MAKKVTPTKGFIRISEVCGLLGISPRTVRVWCDAGYLRTNRTMGGHRRVKYADVVAAGKLNERRSALDPAERECAEEALARVVRADPHPGPLDGLLRRDTDVSDVSDVSKLSDVSDVFGLDEL